MAEERKGGPPGVVPLIIGGPSGGTASTGRHKSLTTLSMKGIPADRIDGFVSSLQALGFRVTRSTSTSMKLVVPQKDRSAVQGIIDLERLGAETRTRRFDDRWWYGMLDAAAELAEEDPEEPSEDAVQRFLFAHGPFLQRGVQAGFRADLHGYILGLAEATATHLRTGRPARAVDAAGRLATAGRRLR